MKIPPHIATSLIAGMGMTYQDMMDEDESESEEAEACREAIEWVLDNMDTTGLVENAAGNVRANLFSKRSPAN